MWPFSKNRKTENQKTSSKNVIKSSGGFVQINSMNFFGQYSESPNEVFMVAWSDYDQARQMGGFRASGEGTYVVFENIAVLHSGRLQRPNNGKIANNGTYIINDWMFGEGLKGTFYAFELSGKQVIKHRFSANLFNNGISEDGRFAVCQCANSNTKDGSVLAFFNLEKGMLLWKIVPESGWADSYHFDCERKELALLYRERGEYKYDFEGLFIDKDKWEIERINHASAFELSFIARERFKEKNKALTEIDAQDILSLLDRALQKGLDEYPNEKAAAYRTIGEVKEALGNISEAIQNYELAISLNPRVGIKRHLDILKKHKA